MSSRRQTINVDDSDTESSSDGNQRFLWGRRRQATTAQCDDSSSDDEGEGTAMASSDVAHLTKRQKLAAACDDSSSDDYAEAAVRQTSKVDSA